MQTCKENILHIFDIWNNLLILDICMNVLAYAWHFTSLNFLNQRCALPKSKFKKYVAYDRVSEVNVADFLLSFLQQCVSNDRALTFLSKPSESLKLRCLNIFHMYLLSSIFCICKDNVLVYIFLYSVAHLCKNQRCNETM